jgi:hypothetical protein
VDSGWDVTWLPYRIQLAREYESGWTLYEYVFPKFLAKPDWIGKVFRLGGVLLIVLMLCWTRPKDVQSVLARGLVAVIAFIAVQLFFSPQWLLWLLPFLVPLAALDRRILWLAVGLDVVTYLSFPIAFDTGGHPAAWMLRVPLVYARAAIWLALTVIVLFLMRPCTNGVLRQPLKESR